MIKKYRYGTPIQTDAVTKEIVCEKDEQIFFNKNNLTLSVSLEEDEAVYGLGENVRGINKRGFSYESCNADDPLHTEGKRSLYAAHNFLILDGEEKTGIFFDYAGTVVFDIGFLDNSLLQITPQDENYDLYIITGETLLLIVHQFRQLIGKSYIAPKWAFGYAQSRWSYENEEQVMEVISKYRQEGIGLDSVYLDIDYMDHYKDFTVDQKAFPDLSGFSEKLMKKGIHLVPIIDAGVKIEKGYSVYEEGVSNNYFCKDEHGNDFVAGVWPGRVHFPDMLNSKAREWFGNKYQFLLDQGIEGFWNDMNEPAIFYSEEHLKEVFQQLEELKDQNLDINSFFGMMDLCQGISNNKGDYKRFYHNMDGLIIRHDKVHNLYGFNMTRAAGEAFERLCPKKRILLFSRSSYIGMHRYGGIWMGDNQSWWSHILLNLKMLPSLNMCGFLYIGADLGGFGDHTSKDLLLRWLALGIFTPLMRNHSAQGTRQQELYEFGDTEPFSRLIRIRYALLPYLYSEYMKAALEDKMMFLPLHFVFPEDARSKEIEDQLFVGESIMIAPVYEQNKSGRMVYLPQDMKLIRMHSDTEYEEEILSKGDHYISIALDEIVFFIKKDHCLPIIKAADCVSHLDESDRTMLSYTSHPVTYQLYTDDGYTKEYEEAMHMITLKS